MAAEKLLVLPPANITRCRLVKRINRFVVEVLVGGQRVLSHLSNTGRLEQYMIPGRECIMAKIKGKKLKHRIIGVKEEGFEAYALVDTFLQNKAFSIAVEENLLPFTRGCRVVKINPRRNTSVFDFLLECGGEEVIVETKSAILRGANGEALYPDCPTRRGQRHVEELFSLYKAGTKAMMVFIAAFPGARCFMPNRGADKRFYCLLSRAFQKGLPVHAIGVFLAANNDSASVVLEAPELPLCEEWLRRIQVEEIASLCG